MKQFLDLLKEIHDHGRHTDNDIPDRTKIGIRKLFRRTIRHQMQNGFPRLTTKFVSLKVAFHEWKWISKGETNTRYLVENGIRIWDQWALKAEHVHRPENIDYGILYMEGVDTTSFENESDWDTLKSKIEQITGNPAENYMMYQIGDLGRVYGHQLVKERGVNQLLNAFEDLIKFPESRRVLLSNWNPWDLPDESKSPEENVLDGNKPALASCHAFFQFDSYHLTREERIEIYRRRNNLPDNIPVADNILDLSHIPTRGLNLAIYQRSADVPIGVPYNLAYYGFVLLTYAYCLNMEPNELIWDGGNCHIYNNQVNANLHEWMSREPLPLQKVWIDTKGRDVKYPWDIEWEDICFDEYHHQGRIDFPVAK